MTWYGWVILIAAVILTGLLVYFCMKYDWLKIVVKIVIVVAVLGSGFYTGYQLFLLNTATGGTHGKLEGVYGTNEIEVVDNLKFSLHNTEFKLVEENTYDLTVDVEQVMQLDTTKNYNIFINGAPCSDPYCLFSGDKFVTANYTYSYYTRSKLEMTDSLKISIVFYKNYTRISLKTDGGEDAVKYWNAYVNKNDFEISVRETGYRRNKNLVILTTANEIFEKAIEKYDPTFDICNTIVDGETVYVLGTGEMLDGTPVDLVYFLNIEGLGTDACDTEDELAKAVDKIDWRTIGNTRSVGIDYYFDNQKGVWYGDIDDFREEVLSSTKYFVYGLKSPEKVSSKGLPGTEVTFVKITDNKVEIKEMPWIVYSVYGAVDKTNRAGMLTCAALKDAWGDRYSNPEFGFVEKNYGGGGDGKVEPDPENPDRVI